MTRDKNLSIYKIISLVLLFTMLGLLYVLLYIYELDPSRIKFHLTIGGFGLLVGQVLINIFYLRSLGVKSLKEVSIRRIDYLSFLFSLVLSYVLLKSFSPGSFQNFSAYYIALVLSLLLYLSASFELVKND
jgi:hypothetical protein